MESLIFGGIVLLPILLFIICAEVEVRWKAAKKREAARLFKSGYEHAAGVLLRNELRNEEQTLDVLYARLQQSSSADTWNESDDGVYAAIQDWRVLKND